MKLTHCLSFSEIQVQNALSVQVTGAFDAAVDQERRQIEQGDDFKTRLLALEQQTADVIVTMESRTEETHNRTQQVAEDLSELSQLTDTTLTNLKDKMVDRLQGVEDTLQSEAADLGAQMESVAQDLFQNFTSSITDARDSLESGLDDTSAYLWEVAGGLKTTTDFANGIRLEVRML